MSKENNIEWLTGQARVTVSFSQTRYINKVKRLAELYDDVEIVAENKDGTITAHLPLSYIKLYKPKQMTEEQKAAAKERLLQMRG